VALGLGGLLASGCTAMGSSATGERLLKMQASPQYGDGKFENPDPMYISYSESWSAMFGSVENRSPSEEPIVQQRSKKDFDDPPASGLRVTWLGHSTLLLEIEGRRFLTDPVWGERTSPVSWLGPQRYYAPPLPLEDLPKIDAILISHDHYDHLDYPTIAALKEMGTKFIAPWGVGAHLEHWGIPKSRITEVDWWDEVEVGGITVASVPARHASGRGLMDQNATLWTGYALIGRDRRLFFSGDTGMFPGLLDIGAKYGPFDVTMIEVGAYNSAWPDWHMGPEQAVVGHKMVQGEVLLPIHWGLFDLAPHGWTEPMERVLIEARELGVSVATPRPGESYEADLPLPEEKWWPELSFHSVEEKPIVATKSGQLKDLVSLSDYLEKAEEIAERKRGERGSSDSEKGSQ